MKKLLFSVILGVLALALVPSVLAYNQGIDYNSYRFDLYDSDLNDFGYDYKFGDGKHYNKGPNYDSKYYDKSYGINYYDGYGARSYSPNYDKGRYGSHSYKNIYITPYTKVYESSYRSDYYNRDARYVRSYFYDYPDRRYNNNLHDFFSYGPRAYVVEIDTSYSRDNGLYTGESHYFRVY